MRILFCTQSESLRMFEVLRRVLSSDVGIERAGFLLADSYAYSRWMNQEPTFEQSNHLLLKEWEVTSPPFSDPDPGKLARYERDLGGRAGLFGAVVADRRLFMGRHCTYSQDYRRRFTDRELLSILQRGLDRIHQLFDELKPDVVVGFICVTMLDYLAYLVATERGIRVLNLRPTRVGDRVAFATTLNDPSPEFAAAFVRAITDESQLSRPEARRHIRRVRDEHGRYEGVVRPSSEPALKTNAARLVHVNALVTAVKKYLAFRTSIAARDNHVPNPLYAFAYTALLNPIRARLAARLLQPRYAAANRLEPLSYVFFPLHTEPEVSLLVYGRPYVNQIEIIRWLAMSLPAEMVLVVKEHPWMVGKRTLSAYRKMLNIPRVHFADPSTEARILVQNAALVAVVTGSVALEAAILGKPVITFGDCPYNLLPDSMVRRCTDPRQLSSVIREMLNNYACDEAALEAYIEAVLETSVSLNLYSVLLGKKNVHQERSGEYEQEVRKLAAHLRSSVDAPPVQSGLPVAAALW